MRFAKKLGPGPQALSDLALDGKNRLPGLDEVSTGTLTASLRIRAR